MAISFLHLFYKAMNINATRINPINCRQFGQKQQLKKSEINKKCNISMSFLSGLSVQKRAEIAFQKMNEDRFFEEFLLKGGKVTKEEYEDIIKHHPLAINKANDYCHFYYKGKSTPHDVAVNTLRVDKYFKDNYKNYRIISLGTSPSPITEQLMHMGHDVVFLPISGLRLGYRQDKTTLGNMAELRALMQYLDKKNIDDSKLNIVLDYASSGKTLNITTKFIKEYFGFNHKTLGKVALGGGILDYYYDEARNNYIQDLINSRIEAVSNVPHYPVTPIGVESYKDEGDEDTTIIFEKGIPKQELFEEFEIYSTPLARCFALCTMAEIDKLLSKEEVQNEN